MRTASFFTNQSARAALLILANFVIANQATATILDANWSESLFSINRDSPADTTAKRHTGLAWAPDGSDRLFVLELNGRVRVLSGAHMSDSPVWSTFATMDPIYAGGESGLIGMAFDPDFVRNQYVYFFVTINRDEQQIIRYTASGEFGTGRTVVRSGLPHGGGIHNGGGIGFAADGKLYWSIGDLNRGCGNPDLNSLACKVGRANRDGSLPSDNPFDDGDGSNNDFIFARGFRNPFTMQIQPTTGQIWLNVVGAQYEQVFSVARGDHGGYSAYENNQPDGFLVPKIVYPTNGSATISLTSASRVSGIATFSTSAAHGFRVGSNLTIAGVKDGSFNQSNLYVRSVPTPTSFTALQLGNAANSIGGSAVTLNQGGCVTGGVFYDASLAAPEYSGNFFYGDCNSGRIMRARIDPINNSVMSIDHWATNFFYQVDIATGPDGALYFASAGSNNIYRATFNVSTQKIIVANQHLRVDEGGEVITTVQLARQPVGAASVNILRSSGDEDVESVTGSALAFTPENWMLPQIVRFSAAADLDTDDDSTVFELRADNIGVVPIRISVLDMVPVELSIFANGFE